MRVGYRFIATKLVNRLDLNAFLRSDVASVEQGASLSAGFLSQVVVLPSCVQLYVFLPFLVLPPSNMQFWNNWPSSNVISGATLSAA